MKHKLTPGAARLIKAAIRERWKKVERRLKRQPIQLELNLVIKGGRHDD